MSVKEVHVNQLSDFLENRFYCRCQWHDVKHDLMIGVFKSQVMITEKRPDLIHCDQVNKGSTPKKKNKTKTCVTDEGK